MRVVASLRLLLASLPSVWVAFVLLYVFYLERHNASPLPILGTDANLVALQSIRNFLIGFILIATLALLLESALVLRDVFHKKGIAALEVATFFVSAVAFPFALSFGDFKIVQWLVD